MRSKGTGGSRTRIQFPQAEPKEAEAEKKQEQKPGWWKRIFGGKKPAAEPKETKRSIFEKTVEKIIEKGTPYLRKYLRKKATKKAKGMSGETEPKMVVLIPETKQKGLGIAKTKIPALKAPRDVLDKKLGVKLADELLKQANLLLEISNTLFESKKIPKDLANLVKVVRDTYSEIQVTKGEKKLEKLKLEFLKAGANLLNHLNDPAVLLSLQAKAIHQVGGRLIEILKDQSFRNKIQTLITGLPSHTDLIPVDLNKVFEQEAFLKVFLGELQGKIPAEAINVLLTELAPELLKLPSEERKDLLVEKLLEGIIKSAPQDESSKALKDVIGGLQKTLVNPKVQKGIREAIKELIPKAKTYVEQLETFEALVGKNVLQGITEDNGMLAFLRDEIGDDLLIKLGRKVVHDLVLSDKGVNVFAENLQGSLIAAMKTENPKDQMAQLLQAVAVSVKETFNSEEAMGRLRELVMNYVPKGKKDIVGRAFDERKRIVNLVAGLRRHVTNDVASNLIQDIGSQLTAIMLNPELEEEQKELQLNALKLKLINAFSTAINSPVGEDDNNETKALRGLFKAIQGVLLDESIQDDIKDLIRNMIPTSKDILTKIETVETALGKDIVTELVEENGLLAQLHKKLGPEVLNGVMRQVLQQALLNPDYMGEQVQMDFLKAISEALTASNPEDQKAILLQNLGNALNDVLKSEDFHSELEKVALALAPKEKKEIVEKLFNHMDGVMKIVDKLKENVENEQVAKLIEASGKELIEIINKKELEEGERDKLLQDFKVNLAKHVVAAIGEKVPESEQAKAIRSLLVSLQKTILDPEVEKEIKAMILVVLPKSAIVLQKIELIEEATGRKLLGSILSEDGLLAKLRDAIGDEIMQPVVSDIAGKLLDPKVANESVQQEILEALMLALKEDNPENQKAVFIQRAGGAIKEFLKSPELKEVIKTTVSQLLSGNEGEANEKVAALLQNLGDVRQVASDFMENLGDTSMLLQNIGLRETLLKNFKNNQDLKEVFELLKERGFDILNAENIKKDFLAALGELTSGVKAGDEAPEQQKLISQLLGGLTGALSTTLQDKALARKLEERAVVVMHAAGKAINMKQRRKTATLNPEPKPEITDPIKKKPSIISSFLKSGALFSRAKREMWLKNFIMEKMKDTEIPGIKQDERGEFIVDMVKKVLYTDEFVDGRLSRAAVGAFITGIVGIPNTSFIRNMITGFIGRFMFNTRTTETKQPVVEERIKGAQFTGGPMGAAAIPESN